jgi:hypothetical protein
LVKCDLIEALKSEESLRIYYQQELERISQLPPQQQDKSKMGAALSFTSAIALTAGLAIFMGPLPAAAVVASALASNRFWNR